MTNPAALLYVTVVAGNLAKLLTNECGYGRIFQKKKKTPPKGGQNKAASLQKIKGDYTAKGG